MKKHSLLMTLAMITLIAISLPSPAAAKDAVKASVTPISQLGPAPVPQLNGNPYSPGTYAVGTIQLFYQIEKSQLGNSPLASLELRLSIQAGNAGGQLTSYPVDLSLRQTGSANLKLSPTPDPYSVTVPTNPIPNWFATTIVTVAASPALLQNLANVQPGDDLVANLQIEAERGHFLDTPTSIQVHILVLADDEACIQVFNFLTDMEFTTVLSSVEVNVSNSKKNGPEIKGTNPGQLSNNILVVSDCAEPQTFDLQITLDPNFEVKGNNGVATYLAGGYTDPSQFDIAFFGNGTKQGQNLLLTNITLPPDSSFLATVHMGLITGGSPALLPASGSFDGFLAELLVPGTNLNSLTPAIQFTMAEPNPAMAELGFTIK